MFIVRGENVLLLGEVVGQIIVVSLANLSLSDQDLDKDDYIPEPYRQVSEQQAFEMQKAEKEKSDTTNKVRAKRLQKLGFELEHAGEVLF